MIERPLSKKNNAPDRRDPLVFLPMTPDETQARGWTQVDFLIITGDAYVDHPSFGAALIGRFVESLGYRVGIVAQPRWDSIEDITRLGCPRLAVGITAGNLDSMLNKLTAQKKVRSEDNYSEGARPGQRPNRATVVYANLARQAFPGVPIIVGGIEASLRRIAHYDYWSDQVRRSVLLDAKADALVFGMGENAIRELLDQLDAGVCMGAVKGIRGIAHVLHKGEWEHLETSRSPLDDRPVMLPSYEEVATDVHAFARMARLAQEETNPNNARALLQPHGTQAVYCNAPSLPLSSRELDALYALPFTRKAHWSYTEPIPALETVKHSIVASRGCFGGCSFCAISAHEGRVIQSRSVRSIEREIGELRQQADFHGVLSDIGGPTANMYGMHCRDDVLAKKCRRVSCIHPGICKNLVTDHRPFIELLRVIRRTKGVNKAFIASGIRYDLALLSPEFIAELATHHTGGQLSVAPEHSENRVLEKMRKPSMDSYELFADTFMRASAKAGKQQHLVPYFISGHPGCTLGDMILLALKLKQKGIRPRQVQDFIPTPMSIATAMYHTGLDPMTGEAVSVTKDLRDKKLQKSLLLYWDPEHHPFVREALRKAGRADLIGNGPECLVPPQSGRPTPPRPTYQHRTPIRRP